MSIFKHNFSEYNKPTSNVIFSSQLIIDCSLRMRSSKWCDTTTHHTFKYLMKRKLKRHLLDALLKSKILLLSEVKPWHEQIFFGKMLPSCFSLLSNRKRMRHGQYLAHIVDRNEPVIVKWCCFQFETIK